MTGILIRKAEDTESGTGRTACEDTVTWGRRPHDEGAEIASMQP